VSTVQRDEAWLAAATPAQVAAAHAAGELTAVLGAAPSPVPDGGQLADEHLAHMSPAQIAQAFTTGRLDSVLGRPVPDTPPPAAAPAVQPSAAPTGPVYVPPPWLPTTIAGEQAHNPAAATS
jgi:hypothetical protein